MPCVDRGPVQGVNRWMVATLNVELGTRRYPIHFGASVRALVAAEVTRLRSTGARLLVVTDVQVATAQRASLAAMFPAERILAVPAGEGAKSLAGLGQILDTLAEERVDRAGALFAVGGGVIGDLGGFAAATFLRGISFYQVPTTLLAMVDSSVGGKTGINLAAGKNLVGAFHQPRAVYVGTESLQTLPPREFAAGMAEVIKYGLIGDAPLFAELGEHPLTPASPKLADVVRRCCAAKARVVEADEFETAKDGGRALLNLGHTFGHAIEQVAGYGAYLHGEAVAIGLIAATHLSARLGLVDSQLEAQVAAVLSAHGLPIRLAQPLDRRALDAATQRDKKVRAGRLRFVVLEGVGRAATRGDIDPALLDQVWAHLGAR